MDTAGLRYLRTLYRVGVVGDLTDGQLLERFVAGRDEAAEAGFAALVERHGPMVLRVCRQILGDCARRRGCVSGHIPCPGAAGRFGSQTRVSGELALRDSPSRGETVPGRLGPAAGARKTASSVNNHGTVTLYNSTYVRGMVGAS